jgi:hypothetical protein
MKNNMVIASVFVLIFVFSLLGIRHANAQPKNVSTISLAGAASVTLPEYFVQPAGSRTKLIAPAEVFSKNSWQILSDRAMVASLEYFLAGDLVTLGAKNYKHREKLAIHFFDTQKDIAALSPDQIKEDLGESSIVLKGSFVDKGKYQIQSASVSTGTIGFWNVNGKAYEQHVVVVTDSSRRIRLYMQARAEWYNRETLETQAVSIMDSLEPNKDVLEQYFAKVRAFNRERIVFINQEAPEFEKAAQEVVRIAQVERSKYFSEKLNWTLHSASQKKQRLEELEILFTEVASVLDIRHARWKSGDVIIYDFTKKIVFKDKSERTITLSIEKDRNTVRFSDIR